MVHPLLLLGRERRRVGTSSLRRRRVPFPARPTTSDTMFVVLRRMRGPLLAVITVLTVAVIGLSSIPGITPDGQVYRLTPFEAFYVMSYTATTIGFGEVPYAFTTAQRLWMTVSIYASVTSWAYSLGVVLSLLQNTALRDARAQQRMRRWVARVKEPFVIVCGYGQTGRTICRALDDAGRQVVVIDHDRTRLDVLFGDQLTCDPPGLDADVRNPAMLALAGFDHPRCAGVLVVTDDDDANLAVVMTGHLLRPDVPVVTRAMTRRMAGHMSDFEPAAVINPDDHYGAFLGLALQNPQVSRLVDFIMSPPGSELPPPREAVAPGPWVVLAGDRFGREIADDLRDMGHEVTLADPAEGYPDLTGVVGFVAGSDHDATNLAYGARARLEHSTCYIAIRQASATNSVLVEAFEADSVYVPTDLLAREVLARVTHPLTWAFIEHALGQDDAWGEAVLALLVEHHGERTPVMDRIRLDSRDAPAVTRLSPGQEIRLGDLLRSPDDREEHAPLTALVLLRDGDLVFLPGEDDTVRLDDELLLAGTGSGLAHLRATLDTDSGLSYLLTGTQVPRSWLWRTLTSRSDRRA